MIFFNGNILNTTELYFKMVKMVKIKQDKSLTILFRGMSSLD